MNIRLQLRKYLRSIPEWRFAPPRIQCKRGLQSLGSEYGGYLLDPSELGPEAVVYSLGVGEDISFDLALIHQFGVVVHAFDPTPRVKTWLKSQTLPEQFQLHEVGVTDFDGEALFYLPPQSDFISHSLLRARQYSDESIHVPVTRLSTVMNQMGHKTIDVLKMDVEGAEYAILKDLVREKVRVNQILVEFHHRLSSLGTKETRDTLSMLNAYGMKVCYVCPRIEVFTLVSAR